MCDIERDRRVSDMRKVDLINDILKKQKYPKGILWGSSKDTLMRIWHRLYARRELEEKKNEQN